MPSLPYKILLVAAMLIVGISARGAEVPDTLYSYGQCTEADSLSAWRSKADWGRIAFAIGVRVGAKLAIDHVLKQNVRELRPDRSDYRSFPSRHSTWAYGIASAVGLSLGYKTPWLMVAGQGAANVVGFQRVIDLRHYPGDVIGGAAIGVGTNVLSQALANCIFGRRDFFPCWQRCENALQPALSISTGASFPLQERFGDYRLGTALLSTLRCRLPLSEGFGVSASFDLATSPIKLGAVCRQPLNSLSFMAGGVWHRQFGCGTWGLSGIAEAGYRHNLKPRGVSVSRHAAQLRLAAEGSVMLTEKLSLGVEAAYWLGSSLRIGDAKTAPSAISVAVLSRAFF